MTGQALRTHDTTGWCDRGDHEPCDGTLRASTGTHWWCACTCHPEPPAQAAHPDVQADHDAALQTWRTAREKLQQ